MFKAIIKFTQPAFACSMYQYRHLDNIFTHCCGVSIVEFEQVNADWVLIYGG